MKALLTAILMMFCTVNFTGAGEQSRVIDAGKDLCLLDTSQCSSLYDLPEKVARLRKAIESGTKVYTPEEVERLKRRLEDAMIVVEFLDVPEAIVPR